MAINTPEAPVVNQAEMDKAQELDNTSQAKDMTNKKRAQREATEWEKVKATIEQSIFGRLFYQTDASKKILENLRGNNGKAAQEEAYRDISRKLEAFRNTQGMGNADWSSVCDGMFRAIKAYMEWREANGFPNSIGGRFQSMSTGVFNSVRTSVPGAVLEGLWDIGSKVVKEFQSEDTNEADREEATVEEEEEPGTSLSGMM